MTLIQSKKYNESGCHLRLKPPFRGVEVISMVLLSEMGVS